MADQTFELTKILSHLSAAKLHSEVYSREKHIKGITRDRMNRIAKRCKAAMDEILNAMTPETVQIAKQHVLDAEKHLQLDEVMTALIAMPQGIRNECEEYIMSRYQLYSLNSIPK